MLASSLSTCRLRSSTCPYSERRGEGGSSRSGEVLLDLAVIRVSIASRRFNSWSNIGVKTGVTLALTRASKSSSTGRAILESSVVEFEIGVGTGKNSEEELSF
jgi:hypothetical protein